MLEKLQEEYNKNAHIYDKFCHYVEGELTELLKKTDVYYFEMQWRIKSWDSIMDKIERKCLTPQSVSDIHDVIGFRIMTLFKRDIEKVCEVIRNNFVVLGEDNKADEKPEDVFGYLSVHFQIRLPDQWIRTPRTSEFQNLDAELQIRTFSQHVWAASSHLLQYKMENTVPSALRRNIYRLAAVLEIVDNELESILSARADLLSASNSVIAQINDAMPLDTILLERLLDEYFAEENKGQHEPFDILIQELLACGVDTVGKLRQLMKEQKEEICRLEKERFEEYRRPFYTYAGKLRIAMRAAFPKEYRQLRRR